MLWSKNTKECKKPRQTTNSLTWPHSFSQNVKNVIGYFSSETSFLRPPSLITWLLSQQTNFILFTKSICACKLCGTLWRRGGKRKERLEPNLHSRVFQSLFFNLCLHSRPFPLRADWWKSDSSVDEELQGNWTRNTNSSDVVASPLPYFSRPATRAPRRACSRAKKSTVHNFPSGLLSLFSALVSPAEKIAIFSARETRAKKSVCSPQASFHLGREIKYNWTTK